MKNISLHFARVVATTVWFTLSTSSLFSAEKLPTAPDATVVALSGEVNYAMRGQTQFQAVAVNQILSGGDRVRTTDRSRATLRLNDLCMIRVPELTTFTVPPFGSQSGEPLQLEQGSLYFYSRERAGVIKARTRQMNAAIRGTEFVLTADAAGTSRLAVIEGEVEVQTPLGNLTVTSGEEAVAEQGQPPRKAPFVQAAAVIQWYLYYPAVLVLPELGPGLENAALQPSLAAYQTGDLAGALRHYPAQRQPATEAERLYLAGLFTAFGRVDRAEELLSTLKPPSSGSRALQRIIAVVKGTATQRAEAPQSASEMLAESYYHQSHGQLEAARSLALTATVRAPQSGFAWARVAELELAFGRVPRAREAAERARTLSPQLAPNLVLAGYLAAAEGRHNAALEQFDIALKADPFLAPAWAGRALSRLRHGDRTGGVEDLMAAAALEPNRAIYRSYMAKAFAYAGNVKLAFKELNLAKTLDPYDPTAWLYSALINNDHNQLNRAVTDLQKSKELNDNRAVFRSRLLLDQDQAVRSANLAGIYRDVGLTDLSVREASRAVAADYGNYSGHLFLANSYDQVRRANSYDLRFETPAYSEYLIASLLGPSDGRLLAQPVMQQDYSRLVEHESFGLSTSTEYLSRGAWHQYGAQYGTVGGTSYALEGDYQFDRGDTANRRSEMHLGSVKIKQAFSPREHVYFEILDASWEGGDLAQRFNPNQSVAGVHSLQTQRPSMILGYDHQWSETQRTLFLASRFNDHLVGDSPHSPTALLTQSFGTQDGFVLTDLTQHYSSRVSLNSFEVQHIAHVGDFQTIGGFRAQEVENQLSNLQVVKVGNAIAWVSYFGNPNDVIARQSLDSHSLRLSPYLYEHWQINPQLLLIGGVSYDYQEQPRNLHAAPFADIQETHRQVSPKAALVWTPLTNTTLRAAVSQSLGGFDLASSVRLEPTQLAGFVQTFRNLFPDSLVGDLAGARMETVDLGIEHRFSTGTYVAVSAEMLRAQGDRDIGGFKSDFLTMLLPSPIAQVREQLRYQERALEFSVHQLLGDGLSLGARYRLADVYLTDTYPDVDPTLMYDTNGNPTSYNTLSRGLLHQLSVNSIFRHSSGLFASVEGQWWKQDLKDNLASLAHTPGDNFWQANLMAGYRLPRQRAEFTIGVLNVTGQDYRLHPINLYPDLPRSRTLYTRLQINF